MKRHDGAVSDETVDLFRGLLEVSAAGDRRLGGVRGAGVDPLKVIRPSKRMKEWHRSADTAESLKQYARILATTSGHNKAIALRWLASKGARP